MQAKSDAYYLGRAYAACLPQLGEDMSLSTARSNGELIVVDWAGLTPENAHVTFQSQEADDFRAGFRSLAGV